MSSSKGSPTGPLLGSSEDVAARRPIVKSQEEVKATRAPESSLWSYYLPANPGVRHVTAVTGAFTRVPE